VDGDFQGVYHRDTKTVELYTGGDHGRKMVEKTDIAIGDPELEKVLEKHYRDRLNEEIELLDEAGDEFDLDKVRRSEVVLNLDCRMAGVGNASCGPDLLPQYRIAPDQTYSYRFRISR
jgi:hypothetical protein